MMIVTLFSRQSPLAVCLLVFVSCFLAGLLAVPASAAPDQDYVEAYLGDTIDLHGVAYTSSQLYLFLTGPGLPANGVTLTDTTQLASSGHFTVVDVNSDQTWFMKWNTDRIRNQINPGTYKVYVSTTPVDLSGLAGGYKVMTVYLKDPGPRNGVSISAGTYTLNPEAHVYTSTPYPTTVTPVTTTPAPAPVITAVPSTEPTTSLPTQKSNLSLFLPALAVVAGALIVLLTQRSSS
jgi:hypothetical protein